MKKVTPKDLDGLPDWKKSEILKEQKKKLKKSNKRNKREVFDGI